MLKFILQSFVLTAFLLSPLQAKVLHKDYDKPKGDVPQWFKSTITTEGEYIFTTGHSIEFDTEDLAKQDALNAATETFVKYCRVDVQCFDRSMELYGKGKTSQDADTQRIVRAQAFVSRAMPKDWFIQKRGNKYVAAVLLQVPKTEFDRISANNGIKLSIDTLFYCEDQKGEMQVMQEGCILTTGQGYAIYVNPSDACYIYVYQVDSMENSFRLFPNDSFKTGGNPVKPFEGRWLPNSKQLYELDANTGKELVYVFASLEPIRELEGQISVKVDKVTLDAVRKMKKMGVVGLKDKIDTSTIEIKRTASVSEIKKKLAGDGAFVYETWFWHK